jgi:hypothetical protein
MTATFIFEGVTESLPIEEALFRAYALTSQGYSQILRTSIGFTEIEIYRETSTNGVN